MCFSRAFVLRSGPLMLIQKAAIISQNVKANKQFNRCHALITCLRKRSRKMVLCRKK